MGGGPPRPPPPLTEAEELALSQNRGRPVAEVIPGGSSSESVTPPGHKCLHQMQVYTYVFKKKKKLKYKYNITEPRRGHGKKKN